jgi:tRNA (adenine57-N1/adenine58-N1)-methyltransferase
MQIEPAHVEHAFNLLNAGGYFACYTPFLEQMAVVVDCAQPRFSEVHTHELIEREMTRSKRGTRPSTSVCHSGYVTIARK